MYRVNYVTSIVKANKSGSAFLKLLKILNLLAQIAVVVIIFQVISLNSQNEACIKKTDNIKKEIKEKKEVNYIGNIEKDWTMYHYKLMAVKQLLSNRTNYGLMLKNFAEIIPENIHISEIYTAGSDFNFVMEFLKEKQKQYENNYKYADELKLLFNKTPYFKKDELEMLGTKKDKINGNMMDLAEVKIGCNIRK